LAQAQAQRWLLLLQLHIPLLLGLGPRQSQWDAT